MRYADENLDFLNLQIILVRSFKYKLRVKVTSEPRPRAT